MSDRLRPAVTQHRLQRIVELAYFSKLITAEEVNGFGVVAKIKTDMPLPTGGIVTAQDNDATVSGAVQGPAPLKPGTRKRGPRTTLAGIRKTPIQERRTPRDFVVVAHQIGVRVVFDNTRITLSRA